MASNENDPEVKIVERVEVEPAGDDEETVEPGTETQSDSSQRGKKDAEPEDKEPEDEGTGEVSRLDQGEEILARKIGSEGPPIGQLE